MGILQSSSIEIVWILLSSSLSSAIMLNSHQTTHKCKSSLFGDRILSRIVFGTLRLHETEKPYELLDECLRLGIRAFDTARVYGGGECERILGEWLRGAYDEKSCISYDQELANRRRRQVTIITKGGCGDGSTFWKPNLDRHFVRSELEHSLKQLGVDRIDLYMLHRDDESKSVDEICEIMQTFIDQGKIHSWGVSNWRCHRVAAALEYTKRNCLIPPSCSSLQDSLARPSREPWPGTVFMDENERNFYIHNPQIAVLAWETLGKGFLAGRWDRSDALSIPDIQLAHELTKKTDVYSNTWRENRLKAAYLHHENFERRDRAHALARAKGNFFRSEHVAIAWCLAQKYSAHVITATVNPDHLRSNIEALTLQLTSQDIEWLNSGNVISTKKRSKGTLPKVEISTKNRQQAHVR